MSNIFKKTGKSIKNLLALGGGAPGDYITDIKNEVSAIKTSMELGANYFDLRCFLQQVEIYQPVYGMEGLFGDLTISRGNSRQRAEAIEASLPDVINMHILDIGSSLGYMGMYFADKGAVVEGWDYNELNVLASEKIKSLTRPDLSAKFVNKSLTIDSVKSIKENQFNACFVLSVLHHITTEQSLEDAKGIIEILTSKIPYVFIELANKDEYRHSSGKDSAAFKTARWINKLPESDEEYFKAIKNIDAVVIGEFETHLSGVKRKLYLLRNKHVNVNGKSYQVLSDNTRSYKGTPRGRGSYDYIRYVESDDKFIKIQAYKPSRLSANHFKQAYNEIYINQQMINARPGGVKMPPRLCDFEIKEQSVTLVFELLKNHEHIYAKKRNISTISKIAKSLVDQVNICKNIGFQHNDITPWNIMVNNDGQATLIDFGLAGAGFDKEKNKDSIKKSLFSGLKGSKDAYCSMSVPDIERALGKEICSIVDRIS